MNSFNSSPIKLLNDDSKEVHKKRIFDFLARKNYTNQKSKRVFSYSLNLSKPEALKVDDSVQVKLEELSKLSKQFSDKMKILDTNNIKEINTKENWEKMKFGRSSLMRSLGAKKNMKNLIFSFSDHQKEFETNWLDSLKNISNEKQLHFVNLLMSGGYEDHKLPNCPYLLENEVKKLEEKLGKKKKKIGREKFNKTISNFTRASLIKSLEDKNSKIQKYCDCFATHRIKRMDCSKNYKSILSRSQPQSAEKVINELRDKLKIKKKVKEDSGLDIVVNNSFNLEEISFLSPNSFAKKNKFIKLPEKFPLPSITHLETLYRNKWNRTKNLNTDNLFIIQKKSNITLEDIIKSNEKQIRKNLKKKTGYSSQRVLKSQRNILPN